MAEARKLLCEYAELIEKILVQFTIDENKAIEMMGALKEAMGKENSVEEEARELFKACVYNALATINTAPNQKSKNTQLLEALTDAKEEIKAIGELFIKKR